MAAAPRPISDHYRLGKVLGTGAFSVVRKGVHVATGKEVAIKIINRTQIKGDARQERILRNEIDVMQRIVTQINHPNLIRMVDVFEEPTKLYIVLEMLHGGELFDRIVERGHYSERDASILTAKLVHALQALHESNIIHRDMKPENLLYESADAEAQCKITDFGLAFVTEASDVHKSLVGTPGYVAPEVLSRREYGPACDVWGMGVILYILLVGYPPFYADSNRELFEIIKRGEYYFHEDAWGGVSERAKDLVSRMLTLDTAKRITTDAVLRHPWITEFVTLSDEHMTRTLDQMRRFNAKRKFRGAAMACILGATFGRRRQLRDMLGGRAAPAIDVAAVQAAFRRVSGTGGSEVTMAQFRTALEELGMGHLPLDRMFVLFDKDGSKTVDYKEFLVGLSTLRGSNEETVKMCFNVYDEDGSGFISREELVSVLQGVATEHAAEELDNADKLSALFARIDTNGDGRISFEEFNAAINREPILMKAFLPDAEDKA